MEKWSSNGVMDVRCWEHEGGCGQSFFVKAELVVAAKTYRMDNGENSGERYGHYDQNGDWVWDGDTHAA